MDNKMVLDLLRTLVTLNSKNKITIVKYANNIKLGSLIIIQSLNSLRKEIRDDFVKTMIQTIWGSSFIGSAVLSSDMTSAYVLYFPAAATAAAATAAPPPIFPNHTNYQII